MAAQRSSSRTIGWLLAAIAAISLVVGGISIMNIMLVSVTERTAEIGLRQALGSSRRDIIGLFLIEALVICIVGSVLGATLGAVASWMIGRMVGWSVLITPATRLRLPARTSRGAARSGRSAPRSLIAVFEGVHQQLPWHGST